MYKIIYFTIDYVLIHRDYSFYSYGILLEDARHFDSLNGRLR